MKNLPAHLEYPIAILLLLASGTADAHTGSAVTQSFFGGLHHPFSGLDHFVAMIAVGLWAAQQDGRARWLVPLSFVSVMAVSGGLAMFVLPFSFVESGITLSLLTLGLLITAAVRLPVLSSAAIVGLFAVFHGLAHGAEMPQDAATTTYAAGFILATALLHLSGIGIAARIKRYSHAEWGRFAGAAVILCGCISWASN